MHKDWMKNKLASFIEEEEVIELLTGKERIASMIFPQT
jgi:hypothetical protein